MKNFQKVMVLGVFIYALLSADVLGAQTVIKLKAAHTFPPGAVVPQTLVSYAKKVEEDSGGRIQITVYGPGLIKSEEFVEATVSGVVDMAYGTINTDLTRFGLDTALNLPGLGWNTPYPKSGELKARVYEELRKKFPVLLEKQKDIVVLYEVYHPPFVFHSPKKQVRVPKDAKGLRIAATGIFIKLCKILEAAPVAIPAPERYMALQRGVIDGSFDVYPGMYAMRFYEVTKNHLEVDFGDSIGVVVMNRKKFESMPADLQNIFINNRWYAINYALHGISEEAVRYKEEAAKRGHIFIVPSREEMLEWENTFQALKLQWIKEMEESGLPAKEFLEELERLIEKYRS